MEQVRRSLAAAAAHDGPSGCPDGLTPWLPYGALLIVDAELRIVLAKGPGFVRSESVPPTLRGHRLDEIVEPTVLAELLPHVRAALAGAERTIELAPRGPATRQQLTAMPWRGRSGRVSGALVFFWDTGAISLGAAAAEAEGRYRLLAESATDVVTLRDREGIYRYVSPSATTLSGYTSEQLIGRHASTFVHPDDRELVAAANARLLAGEQVVEFEYRVVRREGSVVWVRSAACALHDPQTGEMTEVRTSTQDITEQRAREAELRATTAELRLRLRETAAIASLGEHALEEADLERFLADATTMVAETLGVPLCAALIDDPDCRLHVRAGAGWKPDTIGRLIVAPAEPDGWLQRLGHAPVAFTELPPDPSWRRLLREHAVRSSMWVVLADRDHQLGVLSVHERENRAFTEDDRTFLVAVGNILRDAIARHRAEEAARHDALHDALTGLPNRRLLTDRLGHALTRAARGAERHAVLFLDVDQFKLVNDSLGHDAGDRLLRLLGPRLCEAVRDGDTVARFGGDEFVVLCEDCDEHEAACIARRLTEAINRPFDLDGREHVASASIGVALTDGICCTPEEVLRDADTAMYRAKECGRGRYEMFDSGMRQRTLARLELEDELRRALAENQLIVHYQPIHAIDREVPLLVEALVRWEHPERGLTAPAMFIPVAEETNLIVPLGEQVLRTACSQVARGASSCRLRATSR